MRTNILFILAWPIRKYIVRPIAKIFLLIRGKYIHELLVSQDRQSAFGMIGETHEIGRLLFARIFFGSNKSFHIKYGIHISASRQAQYMASKHGVVMFTPKHVLNQTNSEFLKVIPMVALRLNLDESEEMFLSGLSSSALDDVRKINTRGFTFEVLRDSDWSEDFYNFYHRPSMENRHNKEGYIMPAQKMAKMVREQGGEFLIVSREGVRIGAILNQVSGNKYYFRRIGWLHGDPDLRKSSVIAALYWFSMRHARQLGYSQVQLGGTPFYLEDGLFKFKSKWGATIDPDENFFKNHYLYLSPERPNARRMLESSSILVLNYLNEFVVLSTKNPSDVKLTSKMAQNIKRWYVLLGEPSIQEGINNTDLPFHLRPWFRLVSLL